MLARHASTRLYSLITSKLTRAREASKGGFFEDIGYLFVPWDNSDVLDVDKKKLKLKWLKKDTKNILNMESIADSFVITNTTDKRSINNASLKNKKLLAELITNNPEFTLEVKHDVKVRSVGSSSSKITDVEEMDGTGKETEKEPPLKKRSWDRKLLRSM